MKSLRLIKAKGLALESGIPVLSNMEVTSHVGLLSTNTWLVRCDMM